MLMISACACLVVRIHCRFILRIIAHRCLTGCCYSERIRHTPVTATSRRHDKSGWVRRNRLLRGKYGIRGHRVVPIQNGDGQDSVLLGRGRHDAVVGEYELRLA